MGVMRDEILDILYQCIDELNEQLAPEQRLPKAPHTSLFGDARGLDSLGFVNFIALVEAESENRFRIALSLTDGSSEEGTSSFETVGELADVIRELLKDRKAIDG